MRSRSRIALVLLGAFLSLPTLVQGQGETESQDKTQAGYEDLHEFGGPEGVSQSLKRDDEHGVAVGFTTVVTGRSV